ncbi:relaxase/mobilization nuclease domain-containing protein [Shimia thalassica]|uniref:relaxase/mobilization nuclease domain-containing protein n=1 Tax=Shimia thalassica TaxID=1715693 RepID=UPI0026E3549D|nr:hypothetical protein [Shimia thalassica]MDO6481419.1 hypothetical protein [Shimia thalassica]
MIIKSTRVPAGQTRQVARYLSKVGDNEEVSWLKGNYADILTMGEVSKLAGKVFAVRHFSVSPNERMTMKDLALVVQEICLEFDVPRSSANRIVIVQHQKRRTSGENNNIHWHVAIPEIHAETLRTLSSSYFKIRNEKVSRICELRLGHPLFLGPFSQVTVAKLSEERPELFANRHMPCAEQLSGLKILLPISDIKAPKVAFR